MAKKRKGPFAAVVVLLGLLLAVGVYVYLAWWTPNQRMRDLQWWQNASEDEMRATCHQILRFPLGDHHDAFLTLAEIGNAESVPVIIRSLRWQQGPDRDGVMIDTTWIAVETLRSLTGEKFGFEPQRWRDWWERTGRHMPPSHFHPREEKGPAEGEAGDEADGSPGPEPAAP